MRRSNRLAARIDLPAPTPPGMRVTIRRFLAVPKDAATLCLCHAGARPGSSVGFQRQPAWVLISFVLCHPMPRHFVNGRGSRLREWSIAGCVGPPILVAVPVRFAANEVNAIAEHDGTEAV